MTDQDLDDLMKEMDFDTPLRSKSEGGLRHPSERRVLISNPSENRSGLIDEVGEEPVPLKFP